MTSPYTREKIENWVGDFCQSDHIKEVPPAVREHAPSVLVEFMAAACEARPGQAGASAGAGPASVGAAARLGAGAAGTGGRGAIEPDEVEEDDLKRALLERIARLNLPEAARPDVPALCALFLTQLEVEGRLGGGRVLGAYVRALKDSYLEAASGKKKPVVRPGSKIGRNDPCPCGSGKKYKTCCLRG